MNPPTNSHKQLLIFTPVLASSCVSAVAGRSQMGVTNVVGLNQRGGVGIKLVPERSVFTGEPNRKVKLRRRTVFIASFPFSSLSFDFFFTLLYYTQA